MRLHDTIQDYLNHIRHERNLADTTCLHYQCWLNLFIGWLQENGYPDPDLDAFTTPVLRRYQYHRSRQGIRPRTLLSSFHPLRGLGEFLVQNRLLDVNPCAALTMPKKDAAIRLTVTDEEVKALFGACERQRIPRLTALYRAVLSVLCYGALRREEACDLLLTDVNPAEKSLLVRSGKGSKSRKVFICAEGATALREWIAVREPDCRHTYLFAIDRARRVHHIAASIASPSVRTPACSRSLRSWEARTALPYWEALGAKHEAVGKLGAAARRERTLPGPDKYRPGAENTPKAVSEVCLLVWGKVCAYGKSLSESGLRYGRSIFGAIRGCP